MQAIQLNLWDWTEAEPIPTANIEQHTTAVTIDTKQNTSPAIAETDMAVCTRDTINSTLTLNPCYHCPLREVCAPDDCGQKLYDIMSDADYDQSFEDWLMS